MSSLSRLRELLEPTGLYNFARGSLIAAELSAYGQAFKLFADMLESFIRDINPQTASHKALSIHEAARGLPPRMGAPENSRRELIAKRDAKINFYNRAEILEAIKSCGLINPELQENGLTVRILADSAAQGIPPGIAFDMAKRLMPFYMSIKEGFDWDYHDEKNKSWDDSDAGNKSWDELLFSR